jgi:hypothetical protein
MGWEPRPGGHYLYKSIRRPDGRVRKLYLGNGPAARAIAEIDAAAKASRRAEADKLAAERARLVPADEATAALARACQLALEASLTAAGYRRHNYGAWRRRRHVHQARRV